MKLGQAKLILDRQSSKVGQAKNLKMDKQSS